MAASYGRILSLTKQLVSINSVSGSEAAILSFVHDWLKQHDFTDIVAEPGFTAGKIAGTQSTSAIILCGHIDTVVSGNRVDWQTDPLVATEKASRLYGLGTTDMKAGMALQMVTAHDAASQKLPFDIWLSAVAGEEIDGNGGRAFVEWFQNNTNYTHAVCLIAEPTDGNVEIGHRGSPFMQLDFSGSAHHASNQTSYEVSGLKRAHDFLNDLTDTVERTQRAHTDAILGAPTIVPTVLQAGDKTSPNKTSGMAELILDIRTTPSLDTVFQTWLEDICERYGAIWNDVGEPVAASLCSPNATLVRTALQAAGLTTPSISRGATDQASFQQAGIDTVVFGPGTFNQAHSPNEYIVLSELKRVSAQYAAILQSYKS